MRALFLILAYLMVLLLPLGLSWSLGGPPRPWHQEIASGLGMVAYSIILVEFVLSGRFRSISAGIGMDVTMRVHQVMARLALVFALLHPLFYQGSNSGGPRPWDGTRQLTLTTDLSVLVTGLIAYLLLPVLVLSAIARTKQNYRYEAWRLMHGAIALAIAALLLHHTITAGRYGSQLALTTIWSIMAAVAVGSLLFVYLIEPMRQHCQPWKVESVRRLTPRQWELKLRPDGHDGLAFQAGQFAWLNIGNSAFSVYENPFSISSAPAAGPEISFVIKELGDLTSALEHIKQDTRAFLDGPHGGLTVDDRTEAGIVLVAGGVGIAPMLSIFFQNRLTSDPRPVKLIYGNRKESQIVYREELAAEDVVFTLSEPKEDWNGETGVIDGALLDRVLSPEQYSQWLFVLCGPAIMMDIVEDHLIARGTPSHRILSERFDYD